MGAKPTSEAVEYCECKHFSLIAQQCPQCLRTVCQSCFGFPLISHASSAIQQVCKVCFIKFTQADFSQEWQVLGEDEGKEVLFIHAEGFSRLMFRQHAEELATKGYRCILIDLPGHGSLINQQFSIKNCLKSIEKALNQICRTSKVSAIGCSLGAISLIEYLRSHECAFKKMILLSSCSKGKIGDVQGKRLIHSARTDIRKSTLNRIIEGGLYPMRQKERKEFLRSTNIQQSLQKMNGDIPLLFVSGSEEDRGLEERYLSLAGRQSKALMYPSTDEYFWCKQEYFYRLLNDITYFFNRQ